MSPVERRLDLTSVFALPGVDVLARQGAPAGAAALLSPGEQARVAKLVDPAAATRLRLSLAAGRCLLGEMLNRPPADLQLDHDDNGRPFSPDAPDVGVSLSRSGDWTLAAASRAGGVGCDVEKVRPADVKALLAMICAPDETAAFLDTAPGEALDRAFFRLWTAKEAVLKAAGLGLAGDAKRVRPPAAAIASADVARFPLAYAGRRYEVGLALSNGAAFAVARVSD